MEATGWEPLSEGGRIQELLNQGGNGGIGRGRHKGCKAALEGGDPSGDRHLSEVVDRLKVNACELMRIEICHELNASYKLCAQGW